MPTTEKAAAICWERRETWNDGIEKREMVVATFNFPTNAFSSEPLYRDKKEKRKEKEK